LTNRKGFGRIFLKFIPNIYKTLLRKRNESPHLFLFFMPKNRKFLFNIIILLA